MICKNSKRAQKIKCDKLRINSGADAGKNEPQNCPVSQFDQIFLRFFTNKIFQGSQVQTLP